MLAGKCYGYVGEFICFFFFCPATFLAITFYKYNDGFSWAFSSACALLSIKNVTFFFVVIFSLETHIEMVRQWSLQIFIVSSFKSKCNFIWRVLSNLQTSNTFVVLTECIFQSMATDSNELRWHGTPSVRVHRKKKKKHTNETNEQKNKHMRLCASLNACLLI